MQTTILFSSPFIAAAQAGKRGLAWFYCNIHFVARGQFRTEINLQITSQESFSHLVILTEYSTMPWARVIAAYRGFI